MKMVNGLTFQPLLVPQVRQENKVLPAKMEFRDQREIQVKEVQRDYKDLLEKPDPQAQRATKEIRETKVRLDPKVPLAQKAIQENKDLLDQRVPKVLTEHKVFRDQKEIKAIQDQPVLMAYLANKVQKETKEKLVRRAQKVPQVLMAIRQ
jgi:hypothetical protein